MIKKAEILNELRGITEMADRLPPENPYQVPAGYFENLADHLLLRIKLEATGVVSADDELKELSPLLAKLDKRMPFSVPEGYFNEIATPGIPPANIVNEAKVVHISSARKILRFCVAASVIGMIALGTWLLTSESSDQTGFSQEVAQKVQNLSDIEMTAYLEEATPATMETLYQKDVLSAEIKNEDVKLMLADISDDDLQHYLDQYNDATPIIN